MAAMRAHAAMHVRQRGVLHGARHMRHPGPASPSRLPAIFLRQGKLEGPGGRARTRQEGQGTDASGLHRRQDHDGVRLRLPARPRLHRRPMRHDRLWRCSIAPERPRGPIIPAVLDRAHVAPFCHCEPPGPAGAGLSGHAMRGPGLLRLALNGESKFTAVGSRHHRNTNMGQASMIDPARPHRRGASTAPVRLRDTRFECL